jgi:hypothetical protein
MQIETLIDNIQTNTLRKTLETLLPQSVSLDVATGTFEIGAFLSLGETWQHLDGIRLLMGDETTRRTKEQIVEALQEITNDSLESVKEKDDTLQGLAAVRQAIRRGQIEVRVYFTRSLTLWVHEIQVLSTSLLSAVLTLPVQASPKTLN